MKLTTKMGLGLAAASFMFFVGCSAAQKTYTEESLGLRKVDLYSEKTVTPDATMYSKAAPSTSKTIDRAFQDAPPMIPHDVEGMLPITISNNQCVSCHAPEVAASMGALPYPKSHTTNLRPDTSLSENGIIVKNGKEIVNTASDKLEYVTLKEENKLIGARFNCSQCHAPQSEMEVAVPNDFEADFITKDGAKKSSFASSIHDGIKTLAE